MKLIDLGDRRETECVGGVWPVCRCCERSMRVSRRRLRFCLRWG